MTTLHSISNRLFRSFRIPGSRHQTGWFGVDIGTGAVKIARIERVNGRYRAVTTLVIPVADEAPLDERKLRNGGFLRVLNTSFTKPFGCGLQRAVCLLPMSTVDYRCLQLPAAADDVLFQMARQEVEEEELTESTGRVLDVWRGPAAGQDADGMQEVAVISADETMVATVAHDLAKARLRRCSVDGLPFALARATTLALPDLADAPLAVVDWGNQSTTLTVAKAGYPWFTRVLRCHGAGHLVQRLRERLTLGEADCWQLLNVYGVGASPGEVVTSELMQAVEQTATPEIQSLAREIQTTLDFLKQQHRELCPQRILLTGGGATIRGVAGRMEEIAGLKTEPWQLDNASCSGEQSGDPTLALFAAALALSALGLEE